ncbi:hypothetical protein D3C86_1462300 [compost metagenome]
MHQPARQILAGGHQIGDVEQAGGGGAFEIRGRLVDEIEQRNSANAERHASGRAFHLVHAENRTVIIDHWIEFAHPNCGLADMHRRRQRKGKGRGGPCDGYCAFGSERPGKRAGGAGNSGKFKRMAAGKLHE